MREKKYFSLYNKIKTDILTGEYKAGYKLPSKRVMADKWGYSVITVEAAYDMLAAEGYIMPVERRGYFVCKIDTFTLPDREYRSVKFPPIPDETPPVTQDFEYSVWIKAIRKVISQDPKKLFVKSPNMGVVALRNAIADYLYRYRGMVADPRCIIIGSGSEQLYEMVLQILGRDKIYGIEHPSYVQIEAVYKSLGANICHLKMGSDGIKSNELKTAHIDVLHVTPFNSYPTGVTASVAKRHEYLNWSGGRRFIIEDDFASEFFLPGQPIESLYSLDSTDSVIYINTFSKSLSPSMRMGYMILPRRLMSEYEKRLGAFSCSVPVLDQYVLSEFISDGSFERHLNRSRRKMK